MLRKLAKGMKDGALGLALKHYINDKLGEYGEVEDCSVDSTRGRIAVRALLKGDREATDAAIESYELAREGEDYYATLRTFSSSRPWLTLVLTKLFEGKRYKLPSAVGRLVD